MATQKRAARSIGSAATAGLGLMRALFARGPRRRRQEEILAELLQQLTLMTDEIHRANVIQQYRLTVDQMDRMVDDPSLADTASTLPGLSKGRRRQMIFANRQYGNLLLAHRVGVCDWDELLGHLRVLCRNEIFAEYWDRTVEHRRSLPADSMEARVGAAVDVMLEELADDPDEWWIVGPAPAAGLRPDEPSAGPVA
ncbi:DUF6082 family protein [Streptomyces sp. NBC_01352]|uniref:DUF6082 family protein n=1 Tax=Streptomyces plumbiresistens TaxID=511811 RepID=A0ABP7S622_9ACTN|nr:MULTISPECIES: DUF6082 family protein [unclassified Streptomyces]MCX4698702.1 DUF6082 family protein [Streptomyces sp. NBC_01373]